MKLQLPILLIVLLTGCESGRVNPPVSRSPEGKDASLGIEASDFAVPEIAFGDSAIEQLAGGIRFESDSFSKWLEKTGQFGELVALSDRRFYDLAEDAKSRRSVQSNQVKEFYEMDENDPNSIPENRVCDLAYQLIYKKYKVDPLGYRNNIHARDTTITALVEAIKRDRATDGAIKRDKVVQER